MRIGVEHRRRLLTERQLLGAAGRADRTIDDVAGRLALLHSTDPAVPYLSLHARSDVTVDDIADALYERRSLLRITTLRRTIFLMPRDVAPLAVGSFNTAMAAKLRTQLEKWIAGSDDVAATDVEGAAGFLESVDEQVLAHLHADGPATGAELSNVITDLQVTFDPLPGKSYSRPMRITSKVLEILAAEGRIARGRPSGDLTSGAWTWSAMDDWLPGGIPAVGPADALVALMERYLAAFGPATVTDATWWTGLTKTKIRTAFAAIGAVEVDLDDSPESGWMLADDDLAVGTDDEVGERVALLPGLDSTTMGWKQRDWYVDDGKAVGLFDKNGNAGPTIWLGGRVVGTWTQRADGEIVHELLADVGRDAQALVDAEAERIAAWLGDIRVNWRYPTPLTKRLES